MKRFLTLFALVGMMTFTACEPADDIEEPEVVDPSGPDDPGKTDDPEESDDPETPYVFTLSPSSVDLEAAGGSFDVTVEASGAYHVSSAPGWVRQSSVENKVHHFEVAANKDRNVRSGVIVFCDEKGTCLPVAVNQKGADYFTISPNSVEMEAEGGTFDVTVECSTSYHINSMPEWVTEISATDGVHQFSVSANESDQQRNGVIVFCDELGTCLPMTVIQKEARPHTDSNGEWKTKAFRHQSLIMRFTATWCGYCPRMNKSVKRAQELYPGKIQHLALHASSSDLAFSGVNTLMNQYSITGYPTGIVDGRSLVENYPVETTAGTIVNAVKETESVYGTKTGTGFFSTLTDRNLTLDVDVYAKEAGQYKLTVLLVEDGIINQQTDYDEDTTHTDYVHDGVARIAVTNVTGDEFVLDTDLSSKSWHFENISIPSSYKLENMRVLVYIQKAFGSQPVKQSADYGSYYVDNCATAPLGEVFEVALEN